MPSAQDLMAFFEEYMNKVVNENVEKYNMIGDQFLKNIEEGIMGTSTKKSPDMKEYYYYWERRVYNALVKMILRALLSYKNILNQPVGRTIPLF